MNYKESLDYKECTDREKKFLECYLNPDSAEFLQIEAATISAFGVSEHSALAYGRGVLGRERIKRIVESTSVAPLPTLDEFKRKLWNTIAEPQRDSKITLGALQLYADISGWRSRTAARKKDATEDDTPSVLDDLVFEDKSSEA